MGYHVLHSSFVNTEARIAVEEKLIQNQKDVINQLNSLKHKMSELEISLEQAELRVPKEFPSVKFLNYKDRKRILVILNII